MHLLDELVLDRPVGDWVRGHVEEQEVLQTRENGLNESPESVVYAPVGWYKQKYETLQNYLLLGGEDALLREVFGQPLPYVLQLVTQLQRVPRLAAQILDPRLAYKQRIK